MQTYFGLPASLFLFLSYLERENSQTWAWEAGCSQVSQCPLPTSGLCLCQGSSASAICTEVHPLQLQGRVCVPAFLAPFQMSRGTKLSRQLPRWRACLDLGLVLLFLLESCSPHTRPCRLAGWWLPSSSKLHLRKVGNVQPCWQPPPLFHLAVCSLASATGA